MQSSNGTSGGRGHIEIGGDVSVSKTQFGEKIFLICRSSNPSRLLEKIMSTQDFFMRTIRRALKLLGSEMEIFGFIYHLALACVSHLCCHGVLRETTGPSLVNGWEALDETEGDVARRTFAYYAIGARKELSLVCCPKEESPLLFREQRNTTPLMLLDTCCRLIRQAR